MISKKLVLVSLFVALTAAQVRAQDDLLQWWWSPGLGLYAVAINDALVRDLALARPNGLLLLAVARTSAAEKAGLKPGDILVEWSPREIWSEAGKDGSIQIIRDGAPQTLTISSAKMADDSPLVLLRPAASSRAAETFIVDPEGTANFRTLTAAMFRAQPGDSVVLKPGRYAEAVFLTPGVNVRAAEKSLARIETKTPWLLKGPGTTELFGLAFSEAGLIISNGDQVTVSDCEFLIPKEKTGLIVGDSQAIAVVRSSFRGTSGTIGLSAQLSQLAVTESIFMGHGKVAIALADNVKAVIKRNLMDANANGLFIYNSELTAANNVMSGNWKGDTKDQSPDFGFRLEKTRATLLKNVIRKHRYGIFVIDAPEPAKINEGTVTQAEYGMIFLASPAIVSENLIMQNTRAGIFVSAKENEAQTSAQEVSILRNTLSGNEGSAVEVDKFKQVSVKENLIEANTTGIDLDQSAATIENNTMVLQKFAGVNVRERSEAEVFNNIVAFNSFGFFIDVTAKFKAGYNNVYGNLASTEFPLLDGNYGRADRYITRDGKKVPIDIYPAYDLKAETDISSDPGFVKLGSDYNLLPASAIASARGKEGRYLGAYAPASFVSASVELASDTVVKRTYSNSRPRSVSVATTATRKKVPSSINERPLSATTKSSNEAVALIDRGDELMKMSKWEEALAAYRQATQIAPNNANAFNAIGWAYITMGQYGDAFPPLVKAIQLNAQLAEAHYGIASAYLGSDNFEKALGFLRTAVRLKPDDVEARYSLGQTCLELGDKKCALEQHAALKFLDGKLADELYSEIQDHP